MNRAFYNIQNKKDTDVAEISIHSEIGENSWSDDTVTAKNFIDDLKKIKAKTIHLFINSPGGNLFSGLAIYNSLVHHKAKIITQVDGVAASIASVIAMAGTLKMPANSLLMVHDPSCFVGGSSEDIRKAADAMDKMKNSLISVYVNKTGLSSAKVSKMMTEETWLSADEAKELGFADEVIDAVNIQNSHDISGFKNAPSNLGNIKHVKNASKGQPSKKFEDTVGQYIANGFNMAESINKAAHEYPEAHKDYISRINSEDSATLYFKETIKPFIKFEDALKHYESKGFSKGRAISEAVALYPDLHEAYIDRVNRAEGRR